MEKKVIVLDEHLYVLHKMRGKPEVILLDFVTFVSAPCVSSQGTVKIQNSLINRTKHLFRVLHR